MAGSTSGWGDTFKKVSYIISSKLEKRYYPMKAVSNKTASIIISIYLQLYKF